MLYLLCLMCMTTLIQDGYSVINRQALPIHSITSIYRLRTEKAPAFCTRYMRQEKAIRGCSPQNKKAVSGISMIRRRHSQACQRMLGSMATIEEAFGPGVLYWLRACPGCLGTGVWLQKTKHSNGVRRNTVFVNLPQVKRDSTSLKPSIVIFQRILSMLRRDPA